MQAEASLADRQLQPPVHQFASLALERPSLAAAPPPNRTGLPDRLKAGVEHLSGFAMDDVRVHYNSSKPATVQALAYTKGTEIHVGPGQEKHLPHEAWHVVQQAQGRVKPTLQMKGVAINDDTALEREAGAMGLRALRIAVPLSNLAGTHHAAIGRHGSVVQEVKRQGNYGTLNITDVTLGNTFKSRHVAGTDDERKACADLRLEDEKKIIGRNTTATEQAWLAAVNGCDDVLAGIGYREFAATVSSSETTIASTYSGKVYTHTPANGPKTLGVNLAHGWKLSVVHVGDAKNAAAPAPATAAPAGGSNTNQSVPKFTDEEFPALKK
jgi:hypothetical protein